ncbi:Uu.00g004580.m01.CDS01 [Anthostomella pinea]|uniref:Uu.00g004580.m01.CDS01 n=1 Tax=Anthostomella pinea TaxID=933095 RepID=A0AAI8VK29_9PEZI|nr:Uu.00g004580.m01.CDS01 [Anthostomella pinea]
MLRLTTLVFLVGVARGASQCYDVSGNLKSTMSPCDPSADVSVCCSDSDYCLDNGLCLDAGGDNMFTVQGCSSKTWEAPCRQYCPDEGQTSNWYQVLTLCSTNQRVSAEYCCGENSTCCSETASESLITLPIATSVFHATDAVSTESSTTPTQSASTTGTEAPEGQDSAATSSTASHDDSRAVAIGLGVGIPLGLALTAALVLLGCLLRRNRNLQSQNAPMDLQSPNATMSPNYWQDIQNPQELKIGNGNFQSQILPMPPSEVQGTQNPQELHHHGYDDGVSWELSGDGVKSEVSGSPSLYHTSPLTTRF